MDFNFCCLNVVCNFDCDVAISVHSDAGEFIVCETRDNGHIADFVLT